MIPLVIRDHLRDQMFEFPQQKWHILVQIEGTTGKEMLYWEDVARRVYKGFPELESLLSRIFVPFSRVQEHGHETCPPFPSLRSRLCERG